MVFSQGQHPISDSDVRKTADDAAGALGGSHPADDAWRSHAPRPKAA
jgi:hypothetical protein